MDQPQNTTPSKLSTRYFPPNRVQVQSAVKGEDRFVPRGRLSPFYAFLLVVGTGLLTFAIMYVLLRLLI